MILPDWLSRKELDAAHSIYRDAADEDYVAARLLWMSGLTRQFLWSAGQAIEKYLKAARLCNGMKADFSHAWTKEYKELVSYAAQFSFHEPALLTAPNLKVASLSEATGLTYDEPTQRFAERINSAGQADVRYNEFAWIEVDAFDLHKLDTFVRWIRGLCFPLDGHLDLDDSQTGQPEPSLMDISRLLGLYPDLAKSNYAFFPDIGDDPVARIHWLSSPYMRIFIKGDREVISWLKQRTKLKDKTLADLVQQFERARRRDDG